jgi:hypothetical protein
MEVIRSSLKGDRAGISFRELIRFMSHANHELAELYDRAERAGEGAAQDLSRRCHLWMLRQDLAGYILLGDPAIRLPAARARRRRSAGAPAAADRAAPAPLPPEIRAPALAPELPADIDTLEEAIGHLLTGRGLNDVAKEYGIDRAELRRLSESYRQAGRAVFAEARRRQ